MSLVKPMFPNPADLFMLDYPVLVTPKTPGVRCLMVDGNAHGLNMLPIKNDHVRDTLWGLPDYDGVLTINHDILEDNKRFNTKGGEFEFTYYVFDWHATGLNYVDRMRALANDENFVPGMTEGWKLVLQYPITMRDEQSLLLHLNECSFKKHDGIYIRNPKGLYVYDRSDDFLSLSAVIGKLQQEEEEL